MPQFVETFCKHCRSRYFIVDGDAACPYCHTERRQTLIMRVVLASLIVVLVAVVVAASHTTGV